MKRKSSRASCFDDEGRAPRDERGASATRLHTLAETEVPISAARSSAVFNLDRRARRARESRILLYLPKRMSGHIRLRPHFFFSHTLCMEKTRSTRSPKEWPYLAGRY